jgi:AcrR family transcriptional regulator
MHSATLARVIKTAPETVPETLSRDERMTANRAAITRLARRWTLDRGFSGYTVDELCDEVGVSRRTFFNYFSSKELAVFGSNHDEFDHEEVARFTAAGDRNCRGLSPTLLGDLVALAIPVMQTVERPLENMRELSEIIQKEPRLLQAFVQLLDEHDRNTAAMIAVRESLELDDPQAMFIARLGGAVLRTALEIFVAEGNSATFPDILRDLVDTVHATTLERN